MKMPIANILPLALLTAPLTTACHHKPIVCTGSEVRRVNVAMMWDRAPEAAVGGMTLYFFSQSADRRLWQFEVSGRDGGSVELPTGRYVMLTANNDLPAVEFTPDPPSPDALMAMARRKMNETLSPTGMLYGAAVTDLEVTHCGVTYRMADGQVKECPLGVVRCWPDSLSTVYNVTFSDVNGLDRMVRATGRLNGVAAAKSVASGRTTADRGAVVFPLMAGTGEITGNTTALGTPLGDPRFTLTLNAAMSDGSAYVKTVDVTDQILNYPNPRNVYIIVKGIDFTENQPPDSGGDDMNLDVDVDGWQAIEIDIPAQLRNKKHTDN